MSLCWDFQVGRWKFQLSEMNGFQHKEWYMLKLHLTCPETRDTQLAILHSQQILFCLLPLRNKAAERCWDGGKIGVRDYRLSPTGKKKSKREREWKWNKRKQVHLPLVYNAEITVCSGAVCCSPLHLYFTSNLPDPSCLPIDFNIL